MRYVIYCRKSSDEKSGKQIRSLKDQESDCLMLAQTHGIKIDSKRDIFRESASAKYYNNRPIFNEIIKQVERGQIDGIIAWHPDRLSRNMYEAGRIIDLLDMKKLQDLKFYGHYFVNNASGKMMLGIMFAISKEYSDKLSENISRGYNNNFAEGKANGTPKWGYINDKDDYYRRDPKNFDLIKQAWEMRLDGKTIGQIHQWLVDKGCERATKKDPSKKIVIGYNTLASLFKDHVYFGELEQKNKYVKLWEFYDFEPMITNEQFYQVQLLSDSKPKANVKQKLLFRDNIVKCSCGSTCFPGVSKGRKKRYMYLTCRQRSNCPNSKNSLRSKILIDTISEDISKKFKPYRSKYEEVKKRLIKAIEQQSKDDTKKVKKLRAQITKTENEMNEYIGTILRKGKLKHKEQNIYDNTVNEYDDKLRGLKRDLSNIEENSIMKNFDYEFFSNLLQNIDKYWNKANPEQKQRICKILFSNLVIGDGKVVSIEYKPIIAKLFTKEVEMAGVEPASKIV